MSSFITTQDHELVSLLKKGDKHAYTEIYHRYKWLLHEHAYKKLGDREAANDLVHDLFCQLWIKREEIEIKSSLAAYFYSAIRNKVLNRIAHETIEAKYVDAISQYAQAHVPTPDYQLREKQFMEIIEREIAALPPKMRAVFELSRKSHLSHREIAGQLKISEETVKKQIKKALRILRGRLGILLFILMLIKY